MFRSSSGSLGRGSGGAQAQLAHGVGRTSNKEPQRNFDRVDAGEIDERDVPFRLLLPQPELKLMEHRGFALAALAEDQDVETL